jgi:amidase
MCDALDKISDVSQAYQRRIEEVNPKLHAVTEINPDAIEIARKLDQERKLNKIRGYSSRMVIWN